MADAVEAEASRHRHHYHHKDSRERLAESGCSKARKKYKAPAPPASPRLRASPSTEISRPPSRNLDPRLCTAPHSRAEHRPLNDTQQSNRPKVEPPPRRSRLFKTRAESKRAQIGWQLSAAVDTREPATTSINLGGSRSDNELATEAGLESDRSRIPPRRTRLAEHHHGKSNTLQRSISNPEFQAELIRVAKKVRDKLDSSGLKLTDGSIRDTRYDRKLPASRPSGNNRRKQAERGKENREGGEEGCAQGPRSRDRFARHEMESQRDQFRDENSDSDGSKLATVDRSRERTGNSVSNERSAAGGQDEA